MQQKSDIGDLHNKRLFAVTPIGASSIRPATVQDHVNKRKVVVSVDKSSTFNHLEASGGEVDDSHHTP
jgi:hypothetical protein